MAPPSLVCNMPLYRSLWTIRPETEVAEENQAAAAVVDRVVADRVVGGGAS